MAVANLLSAIAPGYGTLLAARLLMLVAAAPVTPQAASTIALLVPASERARRILFSVHRLVAVRLPIARPLLAAHIGWRWSYAAFAIAAALCVRPPPHRIPKALYGAAMSLKSWVAIARNRQIVLLLLVTALQVGGQFAVATSLAPLLVQPSPGPGRERLRSSLPYSGRRVSRQHPRHADRRQPRRLPDVGDLPPSHHCRNVGVDPRRRSCSW